MALSLHDLDNINILTGKEHASWLEKNAPASIDLSKVKSNQYNILDYPAIWSGARLFETSIEGKGGDSIPASEELKELIKKAIKENKKDPLVAKDLQEFKTKYKKYLNFLKERSLLLAILHTLENINCSQDGNKDAEAIKKEIQDILNPSSLLKLQTRFDCLQVHQQISFLCSELRNKFPDNLSERDQIKQLEVLTKRFLDCHYERAKKMTFREAISKDLSTVSSFIGLATGVPAAALSIAGIFFPPLLVPAAILGMISFISYVSSVISAANVINEAVQYGRSPSPSDVKWLIIDTALAPFNLFGGMIFSSLSHTLRPLKHLKDVVKHIGNLWNNVISNVLPDVVTTKEVVTDLPEVGSTLTGAGELKNTTTSTSWQKVSSAIAVHDHEVLAKISQIKKEIIKEKRDTMLHGRDFAFIKMTQEEGFEYTKSFHGHILLWDSGFLGTTQSQEAHEIINAMNRYKTLKLDETVQHRIAALNAIKTHCDHYLNTYKEDHAKKGRYSYVANLAKNIEKELSNLQDFASVEQSEPLVLVGFKAK